MVPFQLEVPSHGLRRFNNFRAHIRYLDGFCYPFHDACWNLLLQSDYSNSTQGNISVLFEVFESIHSLSASLRWGHNYNFELVMDPQMPDYIDIVVSNRDHLSLLADPLQLEIQHFEEASALSQASTFGDNHVKPLRNPFSVLPMEVLCQILYSLHYSDVQSLSRALSWNIELPVTFWESRFGPKGEMSFASNVLPRTYTRKEQFFIITSELKSYPNALALQNRRRIHRLGSFISEIVHTFVILDGHYMAQLQPLRPPDRHQL